MKDEASDLLEEIGEKLDKIRDNLPDEEY